MRVAIIRNTVVGRRIVIWSITIAVVIRDIAVRSSIVAVVVVVVYVSVWSSIKVIVVGGIFARCVVVVIVMVVIVVVIVVIVVIVIVVLLLGIGVAEWWGVGWWDVALVAVAAGL